MTYPACFMPGHIAATGHWHPGRADGCPKCPDPGEEQSR